MEILLITSRVQRDLKECVDKIFNMEWSFPLKKEKELQRKKRNIDNSTETSGGYSILEEIKFNDQG